MFSQVRFARIHILFCVLLTLSNLRGSETPAGFTAPAPGGALPGRGPEIRIHLTESRARLATYSYPGREGGADTAVIYVHGLEDHSGWFHPVSRYLSGFGIEVVGMDRRGSGINREDRGYQSGHINRYAYYLDDLDSLVRALRPRHDALILVGYSWGGLLCLEYAESRARDGDPMVDGLILIAPTLDEKISPSLWSRTGILLTRWLLQKKRYASPIEISEYTRNAQLRAYIRSDPMRIDRFSARFWVENSRLFDAAVRMKAPIGIPVLLLLAQQDSMLRNDRVMASVKSKAVNLDILQYEGATHALILDHQRQLAQDIAAWIENQALP